MSIQYSTLVLLESPSSFLIRSTVSEGTHSSLLTLRQVIYCRHFWLSSDRVDFCYWSFLIFSSPPLLLSYYYLSFLSRSPNSPIFTSFRSSSFLWSFYLTLNIFLTETHFFVKDFNVVFTSPHCPLTPLFLPPMNSRTTTTATTPHAYTYTYTILVPL